MAYRENLEAAQLRVVDLERALAEQASEVASLRRVVAGHARSRHVGWMWVLSVGLFTTVVVVGGAVAEAVLAGGRHERHVEVLQRELHVAQGELLQAREDRRTAFEMISQSVDAERRRSPSDDAAVLEPAVLEHDEPVAMPSTNGSLQKYTSGLVEAEVAALSERGNLIVYTDQPATIVVDGSAIHEFTPMRVALSGGEHVIDLVYGDTRVRRTAVIAHGQDTWLTEHFERR